MSAVKLNMPTQRGQIDLISVNEETSNLEFAFDSRTAIFEKSDVNLVVAFDNGSLIILENFYSVYSPEFLPEFTVDGTKLAGQEFFASLDSNLMPAAGPAELSVELEEKPVQNLVSSTMKLNSDAIFEHDDSIEIAEGISSLQDGSLRGGDIYLKGGVSDDLLVGGDGDDFLRGGKGSDTLRGGLGKDVFMWSLKDFEAGAEDVIEDFTSGDRLDLTEFSVNFSIIAQESETDTLITISRGDENQTITLQGVDYLSYEDDFQTFEFNSLVGF